VDTLWFGVMASNRIIGLIAPKGSGKSYKAAELWGGMERAAVFNIVRKDAAFLSGATHVFDGQPREFARALGAEQFRIIYRPTNVQVSDNGEITFAEFRLFVECCFERGNMCMLVDEAHLLCSSRHIPPRFAQALILGRHENLDICYVAQGFSLVARLLTRNTDEFYFWKIIEPSDLQGIRERCGPEVADKVANLRRLEDKRRDGGTLTPGELVYWSSWGGLQ
jgi:hypothetical protein